jgi:transposase InsO family protein
MDLNIFFVVWMYSVTKAAIIPLKDRKQTTTTKAFEKILDNLGIPKTIYSDQGSEYKNASFQKLLDKHYIKIIFSLGHRL